MQKRRFTIVFTLLLFACGSPQHESQNGGDVDSTAGNEALYNSVMDTHDEVMPRIQDLYNLKKRLQDQLAANPSMEATEKAELEKRIANLDSVNNMMMDWMHHFSPLPDSASQEDAREYLEGEMEKIKKVRDAILAIIEEEKSKGN